jgi:hypothetical protein
MEIKLDMNDQCSLGSIAIMAIVSLTNLSTVYCDIGTNFDIKALENCSKFNHSKNLNYN